MAQGLAVPPLAGSGSYLMASKRGMTLPRITYPRPSTKRFLFHRGDPLNAQRALVCPDDLRPTERATGACVRTTM